MTAAKKKPSRTTVKPKRGMAKTRRAKLPGVRGAAIATRSMEEQGQTREEDRKPITDEDCPF